MNLNQVTLPSTNLEKACTFYKTLGFNLIVDALPRYVRFECPEGDATFSLHLVSKIHNKADTIIYFEVEHLENTVFDLKQKGIVFDTEILDQSWLWKEIHLSDPDGNQIIIFHAGKNRKNPPWRIH